MQLTNIESAVIDILSENSRTSVATIAAMLGIEESAAAAVISDLETARVIVGYPALINWDKAHRDMVEAIIEVRVTPIAGYGYDAIAEQLLAYEQVESVYLMSGAYDLQLRVVADNLKELAMFVSQTLAPIENVLSTSTHFVLKKYKSQGTVIEKREDKRQAVSL
ncbi:MAG: Lrp/AsnC family transcriptional regulator [Christensenellales bacterium]|jgi:DNA-binding Lrp family transcriptional regulator